jgi:hypothetical protein
MSTGQREEAMPTSSLPYKDEVTQIQDEGDAEDEAEAGGDDD